MNLTQRKAASGQQHQSGDVRLESDSRSIAAVPSSAGDGRDVPNPEIADPLMILFFDSRTNCNLRSRVRLSSWADP